jgi:[ribosomal protein S18]-alanine N-acetyltransferase
VALVVPAHTRGLTPETVRAHLELLAAEGFTTVLTAALGPGEQAPFLAVGFAPREHLHLFTHDLRSVPDAARQRVRRGRNDDRAGVLAVDDRAFPPFWRLGEDGLDDALGATPAARFRVIDRRRSAGPAGYAVTGRAGGRGYLQRLAVHPDLQGHGLGSALVADGLRWARRWGAREVLVNTQVDNIGAVHLYERLGFRRCTDGLAVLERRTGGAG